MTRGHTAAPLGSFPYLPGHLVCQASPESPGGAPQCPLCPGGGLLLLRKTELAGDGVGVNVSRSGLGGSQELSTTARSAWLLPSGFRAGLVARQGPVWQGRGPFPPENEKPLHHRDQECVANHRKEIQFVGCSQLCLLDKFLSSCHFYKNT